MFDVFKLQPNGSDIKYMAEQHTKIAQRSSLPQQSILHPSRSELVGPVGGQFGRFQN